MHRTTIPLEKPIEKELRRLAAKERRSFKEIVNDLIRRGLKVYKAESPQNVVFQWHTSKGVPVPGFDPSDRSTYFDAISRKMP